MFSRFEAIVYRSLLLAAATSGLSGCYLFRPSMYVETRRTEAPIPAAMQAELQALLQSGAPIPEEKCRVLCTDVRKRNRDGKADGCEWIMPRPAILCPVSGVSIPLPAESTERYGQPIQPQLCQEACGASADPGACSWVGPSAVSCISHHLHTAPSGRRPKGLLDSGVPSGGAAAWFARCASLEAAAVAAFAELREELVLLGAPAALLQECLLALEDEQRHVRLMTELARCGGAEPEPPRIRRVPARDRLQLARDNAAEGCVREAFGAISALWQSVASSDPVVRSAMAQIAQDETRHTELALSLDAWLRSLLNGAEQQQVQIARQAAWSELRRELGAAETPTDPTLGLPSGTRAQHLLDEAVASLQL